MSDEPNGFSRKTRYLWGKLRSSEMQETRAEKIFRRVILGMAFFLVALFVLQLADNDYSQQQNEHLPRVGIVFEDLSDPFWQSAMREMREKAREVGFVPVVRDATAIDNERRRKIVEGLAEEKIRLLAIVAKKNVGDDKENPYRLSAGKAVPVLFLYESSAEETTQQFAERATEMIRQKLYF